MKKFGKIMVVIGLLSMVIVAMVACNGFKVGIRFMVDDEVYREFKTTGSEVIEMPESPTKEGYVFRGWFFDPGIWQQPFTVNSFLDQPISDIIYIHAYFITQEEADSIKTVTYNAMDGSAVDSVEVKIGNRLSEPTTPTKDGYIFIGWFTTADFAEKWNFTSGIVNSDITLYAKWVEDIPENRTYTVAFNANGGSSVDNYTEIAYNALIAKPLNPEKDGYALAGWYTDNTFAKEWNFELDKVTDNITLYARWEQADVTACSIIKSEGFNKIENDGEIELYIKVPNAQEKFSFLNKIEVSPFASWKVVNDLQGKDEVPSGTVEISVGDNVKYILVTSYDGTHKKFYKATVRRRPMYQVSVNPNNGEDIDVMTLEEDSLIDGDYLRKGYIIDKFIYIENEEEKEWNIAEDVVTKNISIDVVWRAANYSVTFDSDGGSKVENAEIDYDGEFSFGVPEKLGYDFVGWAYNDILITDGQGKGLAVWNIDKEKIELKAVWQATVYSVSYGNLKGATNTNAASYTIETSVTFADIAQEGYTFIEWQDEKGEKITEISEGNTGNRTITAVWNLIGYKATFKADGAVLSVVDFNVETEQVTEPTIPEKTGYTHAYEEYSFVARDITVNAVYTPIVYTITYANVSGNYDIDAPVNGNPTTYTIETPTITLQNASKSGYTFANWTVGNDAITQIPLGSYGNKTIKANWNAIEYKVAFVMENADGEYEGHYESEENPTTYTIEDAFTFIEPVCDILGYDFKGWYTTKNEEGVKVEKIGAKTTGNKTFYAQWHRIDYTINYVGVDGGYNDNPDTYNVESDTITLDNPTKNGYTFVGWFTDESKTVAATPIATGSVGNLTFFAKWDIITYTVTYILYDGTNDASNPSNYNIESNLALKNPTKEGYSFGGWFTNADFNEEIKSIAPGMSGSLTLYAKWYYVGTITFVTNGGSAIAPVTQEYGTAIKKPADPTRNYYTFDGWYEDSDFGKVYTFGAMPDKDFNVYAKWTPVEYTIRYVLGEGAQNSKNNVAKYNVETVFTFEAAEKEGYSFNGWFTDDKFTTAVVSEIVAGTHGDMTLYANFIINKYTITFNTDGGSAVTEITQDFHTVVDKPADPFKTGYDFVGWYSDVNLTKAYTFDRMPAKDFTLYAKWNLVNYKIEYNLSGGTNNSSNPSSYTVLSNTVTLGAPTKKGYTFAGWYKDGGYTESFVSIPSGSYGTVAVHAKWEIITYTVTYVGIDGLDNENPTTYTVEDAVTFVEIAKIGYTFDGLFKESAFINTVSGIPQGSVGNVTVYAKYTVNTYTVWIDGKEEMIYTVSFNLNGAGGDIASQVIEEGVSLTYPMVPTRSGYIFGGWYEKEDCSGMAYDFTQFVLKNTVLYAKWIATSNSTVNIGDTREVNIDGTKYFTYDFVPLVSGNVTLATTGSVDTFGYLYEEDVLVKTNDDGATDSNFVIVYNVTAGKKYTVKFRGYGKGNTGSATFHISGYNTVSEGGTAIYGGSTAELTFDAPFTLTVPAERDGYVFRGFVDENGTFYTDDKGKSIKNWDKGEDSAMFSYWEVDGFKINFVTNGGTAVETVTLPKGARVNINNYVTTRSNYSFLGWFLSASDSDSYNASVMPDRDITLYAKWTAYALNAIKYDETLKAIPAEGDLTADYFGATCFDNGGNQVEVTASASTRTVGATATVRLTATNEGKTKTATVSGVKVYGEPTLAFDNTVNYVNLKDGFQASWFTASGTDTFDAATEIRVRVDGEYKAGDIVTVIIESVDIAGNIKSGTVENVKLYGLPVITHNEEKNEISVNDTIDASLFNATATDSFGESLTVTVTKKSGTISAGNTITLTFTATDGKGNVMTFDKDVKVYGAPTISDAEKTEFKVEDEITVDTLGLTANDTFNGQLDITLTVKSGTQTAGVTMVFTATVTDISGNVTNKDIWVRIYGTPTITYDRNALKTTEDPTFSSKEATVSFNLNGASGTAPASQTVTDTVGLEYPAIPTRDGYVFKGWYTDSACSTLFDFSKNVEEDMTVYAGWVSYNGAGYIVYNGSKSVSVISKSSAGSNYDYAFVPLVSGTVTIYSTGSLDTYGYLYSSTKSQLATDDDGGDGSNFQITYSVTAGTLYYIRPCGYDGSGSTTVYVKGNMPTAGGKGSKIISGAKDYLNAMATDSFGNPLMVTAVLKSGESVGGKYATYTLTATDKLGNVATINTAAIPVYDRAEIEMTYDPFGTNSIKYNSAGEEFNAVATDSFGNACVITIEKADGGAIVAGQTQNIVIVATDLAGNRYLSDSIADIKVYDMPTIAYAHDYLYVTAGDNIDFMFTAKDSFGEEISAEATKVSETADILTVKVTATDDAANKAEREYELIKIASGESYLALMFNGEQIGYAKVTNGANYELPHEFTGYTFIGWYLDSAKLTGSDGESLSTWDKPDGYYVLTASATIINYNITYVLNGGENSSNNPATFTVNNLGFALENPSKVTEKTVLPLEYIVDGTFRQTVRQIAYTFLGWYTDSDWTNTISTVSSVGNITVYAKWSETTSATITTTISAYMREGSYIYFGSYPQTLVRDSALSSALGSYSSNTWTSYGYYKNGSISNYMYYTDKEYNGEKYRGVYFTEKRPYYTTGSNIGSTPNNWAYDIVSSSNYKTYNTSTVYWFKYEPIKWKIVKEQSGYATLVADLILDSQNYYISDTTSQTTRTDYQGNSASAYSNNYQYSTIRTWLNVTFYETAFTDLQKALIQTTTVDNSVSSTGYSSNNYACGNTNDKIFLLSYQEANTYFGSNSARQKKSTDYAKSQGLWTNTDSYLGNGYWWLRSPNYFYSYPSRRVDRDGSFDSIGVNYTMVGVVPALVIRL